MSRIVGLMLIAVILCVSASRVAHAQQASGPVAVEPSELSRRADLVGREITVDDRVAYYVNRTGSADDELQLKRTRVTFLVPRRLRPSQTPVVAAVVRGRLEREGSRLVCRVESLDIKPNDLQRLEASVARLSPHDYRTRRAWARWAEQRAQAFKDQPLMRRARALEAEALRLEGEYKDVTVDAPQEWLAMARDARQRKVPEPEPSALAHRALRARLKSAEDPSALRSVLAEIESFFPMAKTDTGAGRTDLGGRASEYEDDPASAYRSSPEVLRKAFDRRLWADARQRLLESEPIPNLNAGIATADRAASELPERRDLPGQLLDKGIAAARSRLRSLRRDEVQRLADVFRDRLRRPEEARQVLRDWLEAKRKRLSETDAEGRVALAGLYESLISDRVTAVALLRKAWRIDPSSRETAEAFRTRGFRKEKDHWVEAMPSSGSTADETSEPARPLMASSASLLGLTGEELDQRLIARPTFKNFVASRGQMIEQRVYLDTDSVRYVNLLRTPAELKFRVIADYTLPRHERKDVTAPPP